MALDLGTLVGFLKVDDRDFNTGLDRAEKRMGVFGGVIGKAALAAGAATVAGIGTAVVGGVRQFAQLEKGMNEVFTLLPGISQAAMDDMTGQVKDFAVDFGVLPNDVVPSLYQSLSAGVPPDNVFDFLETAQKAAKGGVTDLTTAVDGISSVVNAYGDQISGAAEASDLMFTAVKLGKTNFEELSGSLFNVIPTAAGLGVEFGDITAAMAAMTAQGTPTSVATTQMRQLLVELSKDGSATSDMFKEVAGEGFREFVDGGGDVQGALQMMSKAAKDEGKSISDMFGSVEAGSAALALTSASGAKKFGSALKEMDKSAGATEAAYGQMDQGLSASWDKIKAAGAVALADIGAELEPLVSAVADWAEDGLPDLVDAIGDVSGVLLAAGDAIGEVTGFVQDHETALTITAGVIAAVFIPHLAAMGLAALVNGAKAVAGWAMQKAAALGWIAVHSAVVALTVAGWVLMGAQALLQAGRMAAAWLIAMGPIGIVIALVAGLAVIIFKNWDKIKKFTGKAWDWVGDKVATTWNWIKDKTVAIGGAIIDWVSALPRKLVSFFWNWSLPGLIINHWDSIKSGTINKATEMLDWVKGLPGEIIDKLGDLGGLLYGSGQALIQGLIDGSGSLLRDIGTFFLDQVPGWIKGPFKKALGIESPSKVFAELGKELPAGLVMGIDAGAADLMRASERMAMATLRDMPAVGDPATISGGGRGPRSGGAQIVQNFPASATPEAAAAAAGGRIVSALFAVGVN